MLQHTHTHTHTHALFLQEQLFSPAFLIVYGDIVLAFVCAYSLGDVFTSCLQLGLEYS